jgi:hypothetical protein
MLPVYCGKCLSLKAVHSLVEKISQGRSKVTDDARLGAEAAAAGFEAVVKRWDKYFNVDGGYVEK